MKDMIMITGGAGYIGSHINKCLKNRGFNTLIVDNFSTGHREFVKNEIFVQCDLADGKAMEEVFSGYRITAVIHLAASAYIGESNHNPEKYYRNNVLNTINLLSLMKQHAVNHLVFSSTCATYGIPEIVPVTEDIDQHPINTYGRSKLMIEQIIKDFGEAYGLQYSVLRYFNAAGADPDCELGEWHDPEPHLIPIILDVVLGKRDLLQIYGNDYNTSDGTCIRDYIHVMDLAQAHILAMEHLLNTGKSSVFNLGSEHGYTILELVKMVESLLLKTIKTKIVSRRLGDPDILVASSMKIKEELGWHPQMSDLASIIRTAWAWHQMLWQGKH